MACEAADFHSVIDPGFPASPDVAALIACLMGGAHYLIDFRADAVRER